MILGSNELERIPYASGQTPSHEIWFNLFFQLHYAYIAYICLHYAYICLHYAYIAYIGAAGPIFRGLLTLPPG